jgi:hypothetical protein
MEQVGTEAKGFHSGGHHIFWIIASAGVTSGFPTAFPIRVHQRSFTVSVLQSN